MELAARLGGTVVNADSMQVYRNLRVITARPSPEDEARVPHRLYGHVDEAENYSVGRYCVDAKAAIDGRALPAIPLADPVVDPGFVFPDDLDRLVGAATVKHEVLEMWIPLQDDRSDGLLDEPTLVIRGGHDRNRRPR